MRAFVNYVPARPGRLAAQQQVVLACRDVDAEDLAAKPHSTVTKMAARYRAKIVTSDGLRRCFEARLTREGRAGSGSAIRRDRFAAEPAGGSYRTQALSRSVSPQRNFPAAPETVLRAVREGATVAVHQVALGVAAGQSRDEAARVGRPHGEDAAQDACRCAPCHEHIHANPVAHAA